MYFQTYKREWELTALEFEKTANFPHCLEAVAQWGIWAI